MWFPWHNISITGIKFPRDVAHWDLGGGGWGGRGQGGAGRMDRGHW